MAYKPTVVKQKRPIYGIAKISLNKTKTKAQLLITTMENGEEKKIKVILDVDNAPDYIQSGEFSISLSPERDKLYSMHPANGVFKVKVNSFVSEEDKPPAPITRDVPARRGRDGKDYPAYSYEKFTVLLDIVENDKFVGMTIPLSLRYHFTGVVEEIKGKKRNVTGYNKPKSKYSGILMDFCDASGVWDKGAMQWKANILPMMEKRILSADKTFTVSLKNGWVETIWESLDDLSEPDKELEDFEDVEEEFESEETESEDDDLEPDEEEDDLDWEE